MAERMMTSLANVSFSEKYYVIRNYYCIGRKKQMGAKKIKYM